MMVRFLHTADWQLGMTRFYMEGEAQARFSQARIDAIRRIGALAVEERCEFVVVCGDVFESNQVERRVVVRALEAMADIPHVTFYLLPGNHDPFDASSVYRSFTFKKHRPENVVVLKGSDPREVSPGVELIPAPWFSKRPITDLVNDACGRLDPSDAVRIVVGHGPLDSLLPNLSDPKRISLSGLEESIDAKLIHYVALGDRHSKTEEGRTGRVWYSGTPEPTDFDEVDPGKVLVVSLDRDSVEVEDRPVGDWKFRRPSWELTGDADLENLEEWLSDLRDKERTIVRVDLVGQISLTQNVRLEKLFDHHSDLLAVLDRWKDSSLVVVPDDFDIEEFGLSGFAQQALDDLLELARAGEQATVAGDALALLYRLSGESR